MAPTIDRLLEAALYVSDLDRSAEFYARVFKFEVIARGDRLVALGVLARQVLLLFKQGGSIHLPKTPHGASGQSHVAFAIPAEELETWRQWLTSQEVPIVDETRWERGGVSLYFRDPDGHLLEVATPGVWTIY
jgi:catechol 2,3-dioxygenase-like lactoylglutathione lyase family enzyme